MENCFEKNLKVSVQNDELLKVGEMVFHVKEQTITNAEKQQLFRVTCKDAITIYTNGNRIGTSLENLTNNPVDSITINSNYGNVVSLYFANGNYDVKITNKQNITRLSSQNDVNLKSIIVFNLEDLQYLLSMNTLHFPYGDSYGDIKYLKTIPKLAFLQSQGADKIVGDISNLAECRKLTNINFYSSKISGTIESMANGMVSGNNARTSGSIAMAINNIVTIGGNTLPNGTTKTLYFGTSMPSDKTPAEEAQGWCIR